jgi:hypothetical protein
MPERNPRRQARQAVISTGQACGSDSCGPMTRNHSRAVPVSRLNGFGSLRCRTCPFRSRRWSTSSKRREFDALVPPVLLEDGSNPTDDEAGDTSILEDRPDNPTAHELKEARSKH